MDSDRIACIAICSVMLGLLVVGVAHNVWAKYRSRQLMHAMFIGVNDNMGTQYLMLEGGLRRIEGTLNTKLEEVRTSMVGLHEEMRTGLASM